MSTPTPTPEPTVDETLQELKDAIANPPPPQDEPTQISLFNTFSDNLTSTEAVKQMTDQMTEFSHATLQLDDAFHDILSGFTNLQASAVAAGNADLQNDVSALATRWSGYRQNYVDLLWLSREVAGKGEAFAKDWSTDFSTFLADDSVSLEDKKTELDNYIKKLGDDEEVSSQLSQGFQDLAQNVSEFQSDWNNVVQKYDLDKLSDRITDLDGQWTSIEHQLTQLKLQIIELAALVIGLTVVGIVAAYVAIDGSPYWFLLTLAALAGSITAVVLGLRAWGQYQRLAKFQTQLLSQRAELVAEQGAIQALQANYNKAKTNLGTIALNLGSFGAVQTGLRNEAQSIADEFASVQASATSDLFKSRLKATSALYGSLANGLHTYQTVVTTANPIFDGKQ